VLTGNGDCVIGDFLTWTNLGCTTTEGGTITIKFLTDTTAQGSGQASITHEGVGCEEPDCGWNIELSASRCTDCWPCQ